MVKWIKSRRSMTKMHFAFMDLVDNSKVYYYKDCYGMIWMAASKWGHRVKAYNQ